MAAQKREEIEKSKAAGLATAQLKKKRKLERALEREEEKKIVELEFAGIDDNVNDEIELSDVVEQKKKEVVKEKVIRPRKKGTIPYNFGERILLVGEGKLNTVLLLILLIITS